MFASMAAASSSESQARAPKPGALTPNSQATVHARLPRPAWQGRAGGPPPTTARRAATWVEPLQHPGVQVQLRQRWEALQGVGARHGGGQPAQAGSRGGLHLEAGENKKRGVFQNCRRATRGCAENAACWDARGMSCPGCASEGSHDSRCSAMAAPGQGGPRPAGRLPSHQAAAQQGLGAAGVARCQAQRAQRQPRQQRWQQQKVGLGGGGEVQGEGHAMGRGSHLQAKARRQLTINCRPVAMLPMSILSRRGHSAWGHAKPLFRCRTGEQACLERHGQPSHAARL